jgi:hypothetical protein
MLVAVVAGVLLATPAASRAQGGPDSANRSAGASGAAGALPPLASMVRHEATPDSTVRFVATMNVGEVVAAALHVSPAIAQATGDLRAGRSGERVAYGEFLPSLTLNSLAFQSGQHSLPTTPLTQRPLARRSSPIRASFTRLVWSPHTTSSPEAVGAVRSPPRGPPRGRQMPGSSLRRKSPWSPHYTAIESHGRRWKRSSDASYRETSAP